MCPTNLTKLMMQLGILHNIVTHQLSLVSQDSEGVGFHVGSPETQFEAGCAIAFSGSFGEIDVDFEFDGFADTTAVVGFGHV